MLILVVMGLYLTVVQKYICFVKCSSWVLKIYWKNIFFQHKVASFSALFAILDLN